MKMVKSLLLGSAAGLVAVTAGQAADLPVKAKPVEYVRICSLYGAGFYYMPGTDMCIKIGGWVRTEAVWGNDNGTLAFGQFAGQQNLRTTNNFATRARGYITADAREQTAYGTARAYIDVGISTNDVGTNASEGVGVAPSIFSSNRAFIQWAGITTGLTQSFYDFYSSPAVAYRGLPSEDSGDGGWWVTAYTAQLGNGLSATISAEQRRVTQIIGASGEEGGEFESGQLSDAAPGINAMGYGGNQVPDIVANLRLDQTWGSAQVMGALHELNPVYFENDENNANGFGHPSDRWGWVIGAGLRLNFPMIAQGDYFQGEVNYTEGALRYLNHGQGVNFNNLQSNTGSYGIMSDCVWGATNGGVDPPPVTGATSCNQTSAWSFNASYEHYWTPSVHQSLVGMYEAVKYNGQANAILCTTEGEGGAVAFSAAAGCNNNWSVWGLSSRLQWDITKSFYIGVEGLYEHMQSASSSTGLVPLAVGLNGAPAPLPGLTTVGGAAQNAWIGTVRMHKDFLP